MTKIEKSKSKSTFYRNKKKNEHFQELLLNHYKYFNIISPLPNDRYNIMHNYELEIENEN